MKEPFTTRGFSESSDAIAIIVGSTYNGEPTNEVREETTHWGKPSAPIGLVNQEGSGGVYVLPRHGLDHKYPAHLIPYRANMAALKKLGAVAVISIGTVGSVSSNLSPGTIVVPEQIIDWTDGRHSTYWDDSHVGHHIQFADPFCPIGRHYVTEVASEIHNINVESSGTMAVIGGPRFSTRAESVMLSNLGADVIGMTAMPEASLARELGMCYASLCLVTDMDAATGSADAVTENRVRSVAAEYSQAVLDIAFATAERWSSDPRTCACQ